MHNTVSQNPMSASIPQVIASGTANIPVIVFYVDERQERLLSYQISNLFDIAATMVLTPGLIRKQAEAQ